MAAHLIPFAMSEGGSLADILRIAGIGSRSEAAEDTSGSRRRKRRRVEAEDPAPAEAAAPRAKRRRESPMEVPPVATEPYRWDPGSESEAEDYFNEAGPQTVFLRRQQPRTGVVDPVTSGPLTATGIPYVNRSDPGRAITESPDSDSDDAPSGIPGSDVGARGNCLLCSYGSQAIDASPIGSQQFATLIKTLEDYYAVKSPQALLELVTRWVQRMRRDHPQVELPPFNRKAVLEHLSTNLHTVNSRVAIAVQLRRMENLQIVTMNNIYVDGDIDVKAIDGVRRITETILKLHSTDPTKLLFASPVVDDVTPKLNGSYSLSLAMDQALLKPDTQHTSKFLRRVMQNNGQRVQEADEEADSPARLLQYRRDAARRLLEAPPPLVAPRTPSSTSGGSGREAESEDETEARMRTLFRS